MRHLDGEEPYYSLPVPDWEQSQGKAGTCTIEVRMVVGGGADLEKQTCQSSLEPRRDWSGDRFYRSVLRFGKLFGHFEKAPGPSHAPN